MTTPPSGKSYGAVPRAAAETPTLRLVFFDGPLELGWSHAGATAEFLGDFFSGLSAASGANVNDARHSIGYLVNELAENAVKFRAPGDVVLEASLDGRNFTLKLANFASAETTTRFGTLLEEIVSRDPGELLIERIEANAEDPEAGGSGLGILTLMNDYGAELGWTFEQAGRDAPVRLETFAALALS